MEDLLAEMERCLQDLHDWDGQSSTAISASVRKFVSGYQSCIRRNGKPILPPLMTDEKRSEMRKYKDAAIQKEKELLMRQELPRRFEDQDSKLDQDKKTNLSLVLEEPHHFLTEKESHLLRSEAGLTMDQATSTADRMFVNASVNLPDNSGGRQSGCTDPGNRGSFHSFRRVGSTLDQATSTADQIFVDASVNLPNNSGVRRSGPTDRGNGGTSHSSRGGGFNANLLEHRRGELYDGRVSSPSLGEMDQQGLGESLPSTDSSSDVSALNRTVINLSDLQDQSREVEEDIGSGTESSDRSESGTVVAKGSQSSVRGGESGTQIEAGTSDAEARGRPEEGGTGIEDVQESRKDKNGPSVDEQEERGFEQKYLAGTSSLRQSFSDTESFISFIGDYNKLPTPTPPNSSTPEVLPDEEKPKTDHIFGQNEGVTSSYMGHLSSGKGVMVDEGSSPEGHQQSLEDSRRTPGGLSTRDTNISSLGSLGQSCTLPISVTASCDSTLADISERLDTPSIMEELPRDEPGYHGRTKASDPAAAEGIKDRSGSGTDSSIPSTVRRGPVGQEAEDDSRGSSGMENATTDADKKEEMWLTGAEGTGGQGSPGALSSPVRRVRKDSYTLEIPSPALLDAEARNEAPYAQSLDMGDEMQRGGSLNGDLRGTGENMVSDVPVDEVALVSQLELLEEIKRRLAMEQQQQLQELLERQKKEQWLLQQEMSDVQRKVIASRASSEQNAGRPWTPDDRESPLTGTNVQRGVINSRAGGERNAERLWTLDDQDSLLNGTMTEAGITRDTEQPSISDDDRLLQGDPPDIADRVGSEQGTKQWWTPDSSTMGTTMNSAEEDPSWPPAERGLDRRWSPDDLHNFSTGRGHSEPTNLAAAVQGGGLGGDGNPFSSETTSVQDSLEQEPCVSRGHSGNTTGQVTGSMRGPYADPTFQPGTDGWSRTMAVLSRQRTPVRIEDKGSPPSSYFSDGSRVLNRLPNKPGGGNGFYLEHGSEMEQNTGHGHQLDAPDTSVELDAKYDRICAAAKGFLTRRLMATTRVQEIVKTIKDSNVFIVKMQTETPIRGGNISAQDAALAQRIFNQLRAARFELYDIFHSLTPASRMGLLRQDTEAAKQQLITRKSVTDEVPSRPLSAATLKALERKKKAKEAEMQKSLMDKTKGSRIETSRPKSAPNSRILKPLQGHEAPSFPTRPVSSAAYRSNRTNLNHKPVRITVASRGNNRGESEIKTNNRPKQNVPTVAIPTKPQSNVRRVLYPAPSNSTKKITRKQASKKPFKP